MGTESAIPDNLYRYSDRCTAGAQELQSWISSVLVPTIELYLQSTVPKEGLESVDLSAVTRWTNGRKYTSGGIAAELAKKIAEAYYTDRDVRNTGRLFQEAGDGGAQLYGPGGLPVQSLPVGVLMDAEQGVTTNGDRLNALDRADGEALARSLGHAKDSAADPFFRKLALHADDPQFCAGFYNALTGTINEPLWLPKNGIAVQALVSAFASGALARSTEDRITAAMGFQERYGSTPQMQHLLSALAADPTASANFIRYLSTRPDELNRFLSGFSPTHDRYGYHSEFQARDQRAFLAVLTSAVNTMKPDEVTGLLHRLGGPYFTIDYDDFRTIRPDLQKFLTAALTQAVPAGLPSHPTQAQLTEWSAKYGQNLRSLIPLEQAIGQLYDGHRQNISDEHAFWENTVVGVLLAIPTLGSDLPAAGSLGLAGASGGVGGELQIKLDKALGWPLPTTGQDGTRQFDGFLHQVAILAQVQAAYGRNLGHLDSVNGPAVPLSAILSDPGLKAVLNSAGKDDLAELPRTWREKQWLKCSDGKLQLFNLIAALDEVFPEMRPTG